MSEEASKRNKKEKRKEKEPSHFGFASTNEVLEFVVELDVPVERARRRRRGAANVEVNKGIVVGLAMQVLRLEDDAVAVEDESLKRT